MAHEVNFDGLVGPTHSGLRSSVVTRTETPFLRLRQPQKSAFLCVSPSPVGYNRRP